MIVRNKNRKMLKPNRTRFFGKRAATLSGRASALSSLTGYLLKASLLVPGLLLSQLFASPSAQAVSIELTGQPTLVRGAFCGDNAVYRVGTTTTFNGTPLDLLVTVTGQDNEYNLGPTNPNPCVNLASGLLSFRINDQDGDIFAFVDLNIKVVAKGTETPVEVDRLLLTAFDLDINGNPGAVPVAPNVLSTGTDDIYLRFPESSYRSRGSLVTYQEGSFFGGLYQVRLGGRDTGNCNDGAAVVEEECRASSIYVRGVNGVNQVTDFNIRLRNDNSYGYNNSINAHRLLQLSFEVDDINPVITDNTDYGDAPATYGVAGHSINANIALSFGIAPDDDNIATIDKSSPDSQGDDSDAEIYEFDDENAVFLNGQRLDNQFLASDTTVNLDVATFGTGFLSAWADTNVNGVFDPGEQFVTDLNIVSDTVQTTSVPLTIPPIATGGDSVVRFRFSTTPGEVATGFSASDGEVEDYRVSLTANVADVLLMKRITAINGQNVNPNDGTPLNVFIDDTTSPQAADDNNPGWPTGYLVGAIDAGFVKPDDELEYTVYFLNAGTLLANDVRVCDHLYPTQALESNAYGPSADAQVQIGTGPINNLTAINDSADRTQFINAGGAVPANCNLLDTNDNGTLVVDLTGPVGSGSPNLEQLESTAGPGVPNNSYGLLRFRTRVAP